MEAEAGTSADEQKLREAFVNALGVPENGNFQSIVYAQTPGWDSVAHMTLISEIEAAFDVMFSTDDVIGLSSYSRAKEILSTGYGVRFD